MEAKKKRRITLIIVGAILLCLTLALSITLAWYQANRTATGVIVMDKGILFEFGNVHGEDKDRELLLTNDEIMSVAVVPNEVVEIKNPYIKPLENTVPFYLRAKLGYKLYAGETLLTLADEKATLAELLVLDEAGNAFTFTNEFLPDANNEWFYYCNNDAYKTAGKNQLTALTETSAQVDIFETTTLTVKNFTTEFGSPNEVTKIEVVLIVEALQAADASADKYGLPADGDVAGTETPTPTATTINLESGDTLTYLLDGETVEITEITGEEPVITEADMAFANGKTIALDPAVVADYLYITVYDAELLNYFATVYYPGEMGELCVFTSEDLYMALMDTDAAQYLDSYICLA